MARSRMRRALWSVAALTPLLAACNAILGISDYEKTECPGGGVCHDDGGIDGAVSDGGADAKLDAPVLVDARGVDPVSWAQWKMPNYPADGGTTANLQDLKDNGGEVQDKITGLVWRKVPEGERGLVSWSQAKSTCSGGYRLPTRIELITILNLDMLGSARTVRADAMFGLQPEKYWTTSLERTNAGQVTARHWVVDFDVSGAPVDRIDETDSAAVICVKAGGA